MLPVIKTHGCQFMSRDSYICSPNQFIHLEILFLERGFAPHSCTHRGRQISCRYRTELPINQRMALTLVGGWSISIASVVPYTWWFCLLGRNQVSKLHWLSAQIWTAPIFRTEVWDQFWHDYCYHTQAIKKIRPLLSLTLAILVMVAILAEKQNEHKSRHETFCEYLHWKLWLLY